MISLSNKTTLSSFNFADNSFGFIRFFLAMLVMSGHTYGLGGFGDEPITLLTNSQESSGTIAVYGFFAISGFLVTRSFITSPSVFTFWVKRALRILPGFWLCLFVTAFLFAPIVYLAENGMLIGFLSYQPNGPIHYISTNFFLLMHEYSIAGLLSKNPYPYAFDGSLWTLFLEAKAYIALGLLGILGVGGKKKYIVLVVFVLLWSFILFNTHVKESPNKFIRLIVDPSFLLYATYFASGAVFYLFKDSISFNKHTFILFLCITLIAVKLNMLHPILPITEPFLIFWLAQHLPFKDFSKLGDFSYGIYIYAFPIQQLATYFRLNQEIISYFLVCFTVTMVFAVLSWFLIEQPALSLKRILKTRNKRLAFLFTKLP